MNADQFVAEVQEEAGLLDKDTARRATRATLQTLAERIVAGESRDLAAQLPSGLADVLETDSEPNPFGFEEFVGRIARRSELEQDDALRVARAVFATTAKAVTGGELTDVIAQLPTDWTPLLTTSPGGADGGS